MRKSKREELLSKALVTFYEGGFHAVGMDRLVKETGISKTSMYKYFKTKEDLIEAVLRLRDENYRNWLIDRIEASADTPRDRLLAIFDALGEWFEESDYKSCMFIRAASEYPDASHQIYKASAEHKRLLITYITGLAQQADIPNPAGFAKQLMLLKEGAIVTAHMLSPLGVAEDAKSMANVLISSALQA